MGFWNALSALAPVAPAMSDAADLRTARQQDAAKFASDQALAQARLTVEKLAAQSEQQKIARSNLPVIYSKPEWNPLTHTMQVTTVDPNTGAFARKDVPGIDPLAAAEAKYQAARSDFKTTAKRDLTPAEDQALFFQSFGYKTPAELTPEQALTFNTPQLNMTGGVPVVKYQGRDYTSTDLSSAATPPPVKSLLQSASSAVDQKQSVIDKRLDMEQRRNDMEAQRLTAALQNSATGPAQGNVNLAGNSYLASLPEPDRSLVKEIGTGRMALERLGYILARSPRLAAEVSQAFPDFDSSKIQSYISTYRDFTTGKASEQMKAGANAIQHLYQLKAINDADPASVHNPASAAYKRYNALLNVVTGELAKFYAMPQTNENRKQLRDPINGLLNRDSAIQEQASAMGVAFNDLLNQWTNAKPSSAYQAPLPGLNSSALAAFKNLAPDQYRQFVGKNGGSTAPTGMISVQIPGQPPGQIPAAALEKFKRDHPNAQVVQ